MEQPRSGTREFGREEDVEGFEAAELGGRKRHGCGRKRQTTELQRPGEARPFRFLRAN
jgi:hypothetical protein